MTNDLNSLKVGDDVIITADSNRRGGGRFKVAAKGPKWLRVDVDKFTKRLFSLADGNWLGQEKGNGAGGYCYARTPAYHEYAERRAALEKRLNTIVHTYGWLATLSTDRIEKVLAILTGDALARAYTRGEVLAFGELVRDDAKRAGAYGTVDVAALLDSEGGQGT